LIDVERELPASKMASANQQSTRNDSDAIEIALQQLNEDYEVWNKQEEDLKAVLVQLQKEAAILQSALEQAQMDPSKPKRKDDEAMQRLTQALMNDSDSTSSDDSDDGDAIMGDHGLSLPDVDDMDLHLPEPDLDPL
jgi:chromosome segregation ATPase